MPKNRYQPDDDAYLLDRWGKDTPRDIGLHLGRSAGSVRSRYQLLEQRRNPKPQPVRRIVPAPPGWGRRPGIPL